MEQQKEKAARPKPTVPAPIFLSMAHKRMVEHERQNLAKQAAMEKQQARRRYVAVCLKTLPPFAKPTQIILMYTSIDYVFPTAGKRGG